MPTRLNLPIILVLAALLAGCSRNFGDAAAPVVEVVEPDLSQVQSADEIMLTITVDAGREVDRVAVANREFSFNASGDSWTGPVALRTGLNRIIVESMIGDEPPFPDTLSAFRMDLTTDQLDRQIMPFPLGGHTVTRLANGDLVMIGGAFDAGGPGIADIFIWRSGGVRFFPVSQTMFLSRVGHTATLLPDGRILIIGGASLGNIDSVDQLIEYVELFDPSDRSFKEIPVSGDPIRRMYHTATLRVNGGSSYVDLLGGRGDTRYVPQPELDIRRDLRTFEFRGDTLHALHPGVGPFIARVAGHRQSPLASMPPGRNEKFFLTGMTFGLELESTAIRLDYGSPVGLDLQPGLPPEPARIRHADVLMAPGVIGLFGGRGADASNVLDRIDLYVDKVERYFSVPGSNDIDFPGRYGHTATLIGFNRILITGGFDEAGDAIVGTRIVEYTQ